MRLFFSLLLIPGMVLADSKEEFRTILQEFIQRDPLFKEVDFQTPYYEAQVKQGFSQLVLPKVNLSYGVYEQHNNISLATEGSRFKIGSLTATYNIFGFGSDLNNFQASRYQNKAQQQQVSLQLMKREYEVSSLLFDYLRGSRNIDILSRLVEMKGRALELSLKRFQRGSLSEEDHQKVALDVSNARGELLVAQQDFNHLMARVNAYGIEQLPTSYPWENELRESLVSRLEALSTPVEDLPQFLAVDYTLEASASESSAALGRMLGNISLNFSRNVYQFPSQDDQYEWRTSLVYVLPLFDQFDQFTELKRNYAIRYANEVKQRFEKRLAAKQQEAQAANLQVSWKNWMDRRAALKTSTKLYNRSLSQFNQGQLSVNELLVDQDRLLRTEQIANSATHQLHETVLNFCHSRGKAFVKGCF